MYVNNIYLAKIYIIAQTEASISVNNKRVVFIGSFF